MFFSHCAIKLSILALFFRIKENMCARWECYNFKTSGSYYCSDHTCTIDYCYDQKSTKDDLYCSRHSCGEEGCLEYRDEGLPDAFGYCYKHGCVLEDCSHRRDRGEYCVYHTCAYYGCPNPTYNRSVYCQEHSEQ